MVICQHSAMIFEAKEVTIVLKAACFCVLSDHILLWAVGNQVGGRVDGCFLPGVW